MNKYIKFQMFALLLTLVLFSSCGGSKHDVLIVTGQNNHNWQESHKAIKTIFDKSDLFTAEVAVTPSKGEDMSGFSPDFKAYDVVVLDYNGDSWSEETKTNFEEYVSNGGGVVVIHAADNSFPEWKEYNQMIGLGGWGKRNEKDGPYVRWHKGEIIKDNSPGKGGMHGKKGQFVIDNRQPGHPIMKGMPEKMMHTYDELYGKLRGPAENMEVLATAFSDKKMNGSGYHEPVLMTINYNEGRIFHNVLGHVGNDGKLIAFKSAFMIHSLLRGAEWAATGEVTQELPEDLPNAVTPLVLPGYKAFTLGDLFKNAETYKVGESRKYLTLISKRIQNHSEDPKQLALIEDKMVEFLQLETATADAKNYLCEELSWMGSDKCLAALENLSKQPETSDMANFAISRITTQN